MIKEEHKDDKRKIGGLLLMLRAGLVIAGAIGFKVGYLSQEQIPAIGALALIFIGAGASMKRREESK